MEIVGTADLVTAVVVLVLLVYIEEQIRRNRSLPDTDGPAPSAVSDNRLLAAYDQAGQTMRHYAGLRFAQLSALMVVTGALASALTTRAVLDHGQREMLRIIAVLLTFLFLVMQERDVDHWKAAERSARTIEAQLGISVVSAWRARSFFSGTNATRFIHLLIGVFWFGLR